MWGPGSFFLTPPLQKVSSTEEIMYKICQYMVKSSNRFFRILRGEGVWLTGDALVAAGTAGNEMNEP